LQKPVCKSRLAVVNMSDNTKVPQSRNGNISHAIAECRLGRSEVS